MNVLLISSSHITSNLIHNMLPDEYIKTTTNGNITIPSNTELIIVEEDLLTNNVLDKDYKTLVITRNATVELVKKVVSDGKLYIVAPFTQQMLLSRIQALVG